GISIQPCHIAVGAVMAELVLQALNLVQRLFSRRNQRIPLRTGKVYLEETAHSAPLQSRIDVRWKWFGGRFGDGRRLLLLGSLGHSLQQVPNSLAEEKLEKHGFNASPS